MQLVKDGFTYMGIVCSLWAHWQYVCHAVRGCTLTLWHPGQQLSQGGTEIVDSNNCPHLSMHLQAVAGAI